MYIVISICVSVLTVALLFLIVQAIRTLRQFEHTGKAVEYLVLNADSKLEALDPVVTSVKNVSGVLNNVWFKGASIVYALVSKVKRQK